MIIAIEFNSVSKACKYYGMATTDCIHSLPKIFTNSGFKNFGSRKDQKPNNILAFKESNPLEPQGHVKNKTQVSHSWSRIIANWYAESFTGSCMKLKALNGGKCDTQVWNNNIGWILAIMNTVDLKSPLCLPCQQSQLLLICLKWVSSYRKTIVRQLASGKGLLFLLKTHPHPIRSLHAHYKSQIPVDSKEISFPLS